MKQKFKITKTERVCLVIERLAGKGAKAGSMIIIICGAILLSAATVRQIKMNRKNYE